MLTTADIISRYKNCIICGNSFSPITRNIKKRPCVYCSLSCYWTSLKGRKLTKEHKEKISLKLKNVEKPKGELSPKYIKDRTKLKKSIDRRNDSSLNDWRDRVYKRDNYICKINNNECSGKIEAHHILRFSLYPELRYDINNGITLCHKHHPYKIKDEIELSAYFNKLITKEYATN